MSGVALFRQRVFWIGAAVVLVALGAWGWIERKPILAWHCTKGLATAPSEECGRYVDRLAALGVHAIPPLVRQLEVGDDTSKVNCGWALAELASRWTVATPATQALSKRLLEVFARLDATGRREALSALHALLLTTNAENPPEWLAQELATLLPQAAAQDAEECRSAALALAARFLQHGRALNPDLANACGVLVEAGLKDQHAACRLSAIRMAAAPGVGLLERVAPLLVGPAREPAAEVRLTALLALGGLEDLLPTDEVLRYLHDDDGGVRAVAEQALRSRGLPPAHVQLARQMIDPLPQVRARVPGLVHDFPELDTRLWLERLSRDASPAVRAAVLRAAGDAREWRLADRMREMAAGDPSPTVRQIARYYLRQQLSEPPGGLNE